MKEEMIKLIKLINANKTLNEISNIMGLTNKQLFIKFSMLKQMGYMIDRKYHYNGEISYSFTNPFDIKPQNEITIDTPKNIEKIRVIETGDTHLGHINDSIEAANKMTEYCIKEGIHNVFHTGDFFHGIYPKDQKYTKYLDPFEQIKYGINNYPYDKNIITYICLGNHDVSFWLEDALDIKNILLERRHDLVPVGYENSKINIGTNSIYLHHPIERCDTKISAPPSNSIILKGHSHRFKVTVSGGNLVIYVPTLSSIATYNHTYVNPNVYPSMIDMELTLNKDAITSVYLQQFLIINNELIRVGEISAPNIHLNNKNKPLEVTEMIKPKLTTINNQMAMKIQQSLKETEPPIIGEEPSSSEEEIFKSGELPNLGSGQFVGTKHTKYKGLSRIEKFNARFNK